MQPTYQSINLPIWEGPASGNRPPIRVGAGTQVIAGVGRRRKGCDGARDTGHLLRPELTIFFFSRVSFSFPLTT